MEPGQSETLTMTVTNYDLASYNEATQSWEAPAGKYTLGFAANVEDIRTTESKWKGKQPSAKSVDGCFLLRFRMGLNQRPHD